MNDFDYDAMQKKKLCASARKCKNGSKSRKCSLPSDYMTAAQLRAKNGPITVCNLNKPMSWETFKLLAEDLQQEYIKGLNSRFSVGLSQISEDLFGKSQAALRLYLQGKDNMVFVLGKRLNLNERMMWEQWLNSNKEESEEAVEEEPVPVCAEDEQEVVEESAPAVTDTPAFGMSKLCVEWRGEFDPIAFVDQLKRLVLPNGEVCIRLEVERV